jgi:hypothetical protein
MPWLDVVQDYDVVQGNITNAAVAASNSTKVNQAITDCPAGGVVLFPPGLYVFRDELVLKDNITLWMPHGNRWQAYTGQPTYLKPLFGSFTGTALLRATDVDGVHLVGLNLHSGRAVQVGTGAAVHGLVATGSCKGWRLDNFWVNNYSGYGVLTETNANGFPGGWEAVRLDLENNLLGGWRSQNTGAAASFAFGDGLIEGESTASGAVGLRLDGAVALKVSWRSSFDQDDGIVLDGPSGTVVFLGCQTDRAIKNGLRLHAVDAVPGTQPSPHVVSIIGCHFRRDGKNDNVNPGGYAGIRIDGDSAAVPHIPVTIVGSTTGVSKDDNGTGLLSPDYGVRVTNGRRVTIEGCSLIGTVAPVLDDAAAVIAGDSNSYATVDGSTGAVTFEALPGGWSRRQFREKAADQSVNNSTTLVNVTDLAAGLQPGARYELILFLIYDAAAAADAKIGWTVPSGTTMDWAPVAPGTGATAAPFPLDIAARAVASTPALGAVAVGTKIIAMARGRVVVGSTGGTLQLQFAQQTADPSNATVFAGSWLRLERI